MKRLSVCVLVALVVLAVSASDLFAQRAGKKKAGAKPQVSQEERFKTLDKSGDGFLSVDEFAASLRGPGAEKVKEICEMKDTNKDGKLSLQEFQKTTFEEFALKQGVDPKAEKITLDDLKKVAMRPEMAEQNFKRADRNGDGVITKEDFAQTKKGGGKRGKKAAK